MESSPAEQKATLPWEAADLFPPKPVGAEMGYVDRSGAVAAPLEGIEQRIKRMDVDVPLVWMPDSPRMLAPEQVPALFETMRLRMRAAARYNLNTALIHCLMWSALLSLYAVGKQWPGIFAIMLLMFGIVPAIQNWWSMRKLDRYTPADMARAAASVRYSAWLGSRRIIVTWIIAACIGVVFLAQFRDPKHSIAAAGLVKELVRQEPWRVLTCVLLHGSILHFGFNVFALLTLGRLIEAHAHGVYLATVFLLSAAAGSLASVWLLPLPSVGASGGLMGLIGFLAVLGYRRRKVLPPGFLRSMIVSIALILGMGLMAIHQVDNAAHLGGLLGGIILGAVYITRRGEGVRLEPSFFARLAGAVSLAVLIATTAFTLWRLR